MKIEEIASLGTKTEGVGSKEQGTKRKETPTHPTKTRRVINPRESNTKQLKQQDKNPERQKTEGLGELILTSCCCFSLRVCSLLLLLIYLCLCSFCYFPFFLIIRFLLLCCVLFSSLFILYIFFHFHSSLISSFSPSSSGAFYPPLGVLTDPRFLKNLKTNLA